MGKHVCYKCGMYNGITETSSSSSLWLQGALDHIDPLFKQLGIVKFIDLVKFKTSIIMFKAYHNELPDSTQTSLICMYTYIILDANILSVFIVLIPT